MPQQPWEGSPEWGDKGGHPDGSSAYAHRFPGLQKCCIGDRCYAHMRIHAVRSRFSDLSREALQLVPRAALSCLCFALAPRLPSCPYWCRQTGQKSCLKKGPYAHLEIGPSGAPSPAIERPFQLHPRLGALRPHQNDPLLRTPQPEISQNSP